ncbi:MAG: hypothetical protein CMG74_04180 [Candidatus Marinimicrobia bacterium]|nr:hypothetical protein [Candidatus Neomarinimicrobiota bacterium]
MKSIVRSLVGGVFSPLGKYFTKKRLTIFCYHDISNNPSEFSHNHDLNVPPSIFEYQIDYINKKFNVISPDALLLGEIPAHAALITFDDGFKSYFTNAIPILEKHNLPSIVFLNMEPIKGGIFWSGLITYLSENSPDFNRHVAAKIKVNLKEKPLFLHCSRNIVNSFLRTKNKTYKDEVNGYVGNFATENDLKSVSSNNLVFFGNHLYNHDVSLLMSDKEFLKSYFKNDEELKKYPNSRNMFAFPFGQPGTCFSNKQIELILKIGSKKVFSSFPMINNNVNSQYLHRIPLNSFNNSNSRIWFNILRKSFQF